MSPNAGVAAWQKTARTVSVRGLRLGCSWAWRASWRPIWQDSCFLWSLHADPHGATPLTIPRYAYYYGDRADIRRRI